MSSRIEGDTDHAEGDDTFEGDAASVISTTSSTSTAMLTAQPNVGLEVIDYNITNGGNEKYYNDHEFTIRIWIGQHMYAVQRSYVHFCLFDATLRRKYPRSSLPTLPLSGASLFSSRRVSLKESKEAAKSVNLSAAVDLRTSLSAAEVLEQERDKKQRRKENLVKRADTSEVIQQKKVRRANCMNSKRLIL